MVDPSANTAGMRGPIDMNAFGRQMMNQGQEAQLALEQDDVHEREIMYAAGALQMLEMEQGRCGAYWD